MKLLLAFVVTFPLLALATPTPAAQAAYAEAVALMRAELWGDALPALDRAIAEAPDWPEPWLMRVRVRVRLAPSAPMAAAVARFDPAFDYGAAQVPLAAIAKDCERALALAPPESAERASAQAVCDLNVRLLQQLPTAESAGREALKREQAAADERGRADAAAKAAAAQQAELVARRETDAKQQGLRATYDAQRSGVRNRRVASLVLGGLGLVVAGAALGLYLNADSQISALRAGNVDNQADFTAVASSAGTSRNASLVLANVGGALIITGLLVLVTGSSASPPPAGLTVFVGPGGAGLGLAGVWP